MLSQKIDLFIAPEFNINPLSSQFEVIQKAIRYNIPVGTNYKISGCDINLITSSACPSDKIYAVYSNKIVEIDVS